MGTKAEARARERRLGCGVAIGLVAILMLILSLPILVMTGGFELAVHLLSGFWFFLEENLPRISPNAATWAPGVAALALAAAGIHFFLRPWAMKRGMRWPLGNSLALAAVIPVLFVIAFLVPGILLQVQELSAMPRWHHREQGRGGDAQGMVKELWAEAQIHADVHGGKFPDTLEELQTEGYASRLADQARRGEHYWDRDLPREPVIYLGSGFTDSSDPTLPLMISPPFSEGGGRVRSMVNFAGEVKNIPADEANLWIQRSLDARRK